jgi:hypothetical protein
MEEEGGGKGVEDWKEKANHYNVSQHDSDRREGWVRKVVVSRQNSNTSMTSSRGHVVTCCDML